MRDAEGKRLQKYRRVVFTKKKSPFLDELLSEEVKAGLKENTEEGCDCLPSCTSITYNAETSQADFRWIELFNAYKANVSEFPG